MADPEIRKKQQKEYMAVGLLIIVALFIGFSRFKKKDSDDEVFSRTQFKKSWEEVKALEESVPSKEEQVVYDGALSRVPFKSPLEEKKKVVVDDKEVVLPALTIQGMIWNSARPQAIINNVVYDVDDIIVLGKAEEGSIMVKDVTKEGVYLIYRGKLFLVKPKMEVKSISVKKSIE